MCLDDTGKPRAYCLSEADVIGTLMPMDQPGAGERVTTLQGNPLRLAGPELKSGDTAPDFEAVNSSMQKVTLADTGNAVRIFSVVPSLDTPVCDAQTRRFEDEASKLPNIKVYTLSMDLPFAQKRWCGDFGVDHMVMLSDHRNASFGKNYGTLIEELRIEARAIFVIGADNKIEHVEYVREMSDFPDYETALAAATQASSRSSA